MDNGTEHKKAKGTKKCVIKTELIFRNYTDYLLNKKIILKPNKDLKVIVTIYILSKSIRLC